MEILGVASQYTELALYSLALALIICAAVFLTLSFARSMLMVPPFVPSARRAVRALPTFLTLPPGSVFYDLGAGDGRVVHAMAAAYPESTCVGIEKYVIPYLLAKLRNTVRPLPNVRFVRKDLFSVPLANATHVYLYLYPQTIDALFPKLRAELGAGATVVSCDFKYKEQEPSKAIPLGTGTFGKALYFYRF